MLPDAPFEAPVNNVRMLSSTQSTLRCCIAIYLAAVAFGEAPAPAPAVALPPAERGLCSSREGLQQLLRDGLDGRVGLPDIQLDRADASSLSAVSTVRAFYADFCTSAGLEIIPLSVFLCNKRLVAAPAIDI